MKRQTVLALAVCGTLAAGGVAALTGCSGSADAAPTGITPEKFADGVHAVMMADRTVYAKQVVTRLKSQDAPVKPSEYWEEEDHTIPLPAQMFRMGATMVSENPDSGFVYGLKSSWPLNPQHKPETDEEKTALAAIEASGEPYATTETLGGKRYFTKYYPDKAVAEACWTCHNEHPNKGDEYPTFEKGDVMGAVVVRVPLD